MEDQFVEESEVVPEIALCYSNQYLVNPDWIESLMLFFHGIGTPILDYMEDHSWFDDLAIITDPWRHESFHVMVMPRGKT